MRVAISKVLKTVPDFIQYIRCYIKGILNITQLIIKSY